MLPEIPRCICSIVGFAFFYLWIRGFAGAKKAFLATLFMGTFPGSAFFSAGLTEGPFFLLVALTLWLLQRKMIYRAAIARRAEPAENVSLRFVGDSQVALLRIRGFVGETYYAALDSVFAIAVGRRTPAMILAASRMSFTWPTFSPGDHTVRLTRSTVPRYCPKRWNGKAS